MKISNLLEKISIAIIDSKDDIELSDDQVVKILHATVTTNESFHKLITQECSPSKNNDSELSDKDITYICKSFELESKIIANVEIFSLIRAFRPSKITIKTTDLSSNKETFCEICNVYVLGEPQLVNFNGVTCSSLRGSSLLFSNNLDISNWGVFGCSPGQGLNIDIFNPHDTKIKIEILISGWETTKNSLCNRMWNVNKNKIVFSKITAIKNSISTMKVLAGRNSALKPNFLKIQSDDLLKITNISVLKKQQIQFSNENCELSSTVFSNLSKISFDIFGCYESQGLEISFKNENDFDVDAYVSILGEDANEDLVGQR